MNELDKSYTAVLTVVGIDKPGIISNVTAILAENNVNVINITQTILKDIFQMIMLVDTDKCRVSFKELSDKLEEKLKEINCQIRLQQREVFTSMHRI